MALDIGFLYEKEDDFRGLGFERLRIILREDPTHRHYDPLRVSMRVSGMEDPICRLSLMHPWKGPPKLRVCEGRLILEDWREKIIYAYTLGGEVATSTNEDITEVVLSSPAPIFPLHLPDSDEFILANRLQMELARVRALFQDDTRFHRIIASLNPSDLYASSLTSLQRWLSTRPYQMRGTRMVTIVNEAIHAFEAMDRWPDGTAYLEDIFYYPERTRT